MHYYENRCAILAVLCLIGLCLPLIDTYNGTKSSMYSNVKNAKDYDVDYECMKYLDKYPKGKNDYYSWSQYIEVCNIEDIRDTQERLNKCTN